MVRMLTDVMPFPFFVLLFCNNVVNPPPHVFPFIFMCVCKIESRDAAKGRSTPYPTTALPWWLIKCSNNTDLFHTLWNGSGATIQKAHALFKHNFSPYYPYIFLHFFQTSLEATIELANILLPQNYSVMRKL